jgi:chaperonin cofactor prefoldin
MKHKLTKLSKRLHELSFRAAADEIDKIKDSPYLKVWDQVLDKIYNPSDDKTREWNKDLSIHPDNLSDHIESLTNEIRHLGKDLANDIFREYERHDIMKVKQQYDLKRLSNNFYSLQEKLQELSNYLNSSFKNKPPIK